MTADDDLAARVEVMWAQLTELRRLIRERDERAARAVERVRASERLSEDGPAPEQVWRVQEVGTNPAAGAATDERPE